MKKKRCKKCGKLKLIKEFRIRTDRPNKEHRRNSCKNCERLNCSKYKRTKQQGRAAHLKYTFGITVEAYNQLLIKQKGRCAVCGTTNPGHQPNFYIDHNHKTGNIRGLLCRNCNSAIGLLKDSHNICQSAAKYLKGK